jgi:hypothetical protein
MKEAEMRELQIKAILGKKKLAGHCLIKQAVPCDAHL